MSYLVRNPEDRFLMKGLNHNMLNFLPTIYLKSVLEQLSGKKRVNVFDKKLNTCI